MSSDRTELVSALTKSLRSLSDGMTKALGNTEVGSDQKLTALIMGISTSTAADLLEKFQRQEGELRAAIQAAVESLENVPGTADTRAMLSAALVEVVS